MRQDYLLQGFSMIELVVTLAILAIVALIAYPNYQHYTLRGHRAEAALLLLQGANMAEQCYLREHSYVPLLKQPVQHSLHGWYELQMHVSTDHYQLIATPLKSQTDDQRCKSLWINESGERGITGNGTIAECW